MITTSARSAPTCHHLFGPGESSAARRRSGNPACSSAGRGRPGPVTVAAIPESADISRRIFDALRGRRPLHPGPGGLARQLRARGRPRSIVEVEILRHRRADPRPRSLTNTPLSGSSREVGVTARDSSGAPSSSLPQASREVLDTSPRSRPCSPHLHQPDEQRDPILLPWSSSSRRIVIWVTLTFVRHQDNRRIQRC